MTCGWPVSAIAATACRATAVTLLLSVCVFNYSLNGSEISNSISHEDEPDHQGWAAGPDDYIFTCSRSCGSKLLYLFDRIFVSLPYLHLPIVQRPYLRPYLHLPIVQRRIFRRIFVSSEDTAHETCSRTLPGHRRHYSQTSNLITIPLHVTLLYPCATPLQSLKTKNPNCKKSKSDISKQ